MRQCSFWLISCGGLVIGVNTSLSSPTSTRSVSAPEFNFPARTLRSFGASCTRRTLIFELGAQTADASRNVSSHPLPARSL
ncbi:hypothetical protein DFH06DRAFT_133801 [Mycena polygramma]|nr:hypothetical protein DFH06DRAFT_133801 [Mycena polygramma]